MTDDRGQIETTSSNDMVPVHCRRFRFVICYLSFCVICPVQGLALTRCKQSSKYGINCFFRETMLFSSYRFGPRFGKWISSRNSRAAAMNKPEYWGCTLVANNALT